VGCLLARLRVAGVESSSVPQLEIEIGPWAETQESNDTTLDTKVRSPLRVAKFELPQAVRPREFLDNEAWPPSKRMFDHLPESVLEIVPILS